MADEIVYTGGRIPQSCNLLRALNPKHLENGLPGDQNFVMKNNEQNHGVSTGIDHLISIETLRNLESIKARCGEGCAIAVLNVGALLEPVQDATFVVIQDDALDWGQFAHAHAVITGYYGLSRKEISDFRRHIVKLARRNYYAQGSTALSSV